MSKQDKIEEQIDKIRYEIEDFFDNGERRKDVYKYDDHKILKVILSCFKMSQNINQLGK